MNISDFRFIFLSPGHYRVIYTSRATGRQWSALVRDMQLIDATKNSDAPKVKDLNYLKYYCKNF